MFQPMDVGQIPTTQFNIPAPKPKGGMFGGGGKKALSVIAEAMAAYAAGMGNPGGMAVLQGMNHRRQSASDAEMQEQQYQRQRMDGRDDYLWKQQNSPPQIPDIQERINVLESIRPGLGATYAQNYAQNGGGMGSLFRDPATGQAYMMPQGGLPPLGQEMDDPRTQGGPSPLGSGGFPGPF
jgi:hypothetical protein